MIPDYNSPIITDGNFTWAEYCRLQMWAALAMPTTAQQASIIFLFGELQKIRAALGKPLAISSGIRTDAYTQYLRNRGIPAATRSAHNEGKAVDLKPPAGMTTAQLWDYCAKRWPGRMENLHATPGWVHLDTREWGSRKRFNP